jgi:hypothetical protein
MNDAADWGGHLRLSKKKVNGVRMHELKVTKAGIYLPALGEVLKEEDWDDIGGPFVYGCVVNFPDSNPDDWT